MNDANAELEMGTLYAIVNSGALFSLNYADIFSQNPTVTNATGIQTTADIDPHWNFFVQARQTLSSSKLRDLTVRYRNIYQTSVNRAGGDFLVDRVGMVFTIANSELLTNGGASYRAKSRYQDFDILSNNYMSVPIQLFTGLGSISTYMGYGVKFANLQNSFIAKYAGNSAVLNAVQDTNTFSFEGSAGGVKWLMGGLWDFNQHWSLNGLFGVALLGGLLDYTFHENAETGAAATPFLTFDTGNKNLPWLLASVEFELNLNATWDISESEKTVFSVGYQGEDLLASGGGGATIALGAAQSNNGITMNPNFSMQAMKLSLAYKYY